MKISQAKLVTLATCLSGSLLFLYVLLKANVSSFTHDESFSYLQYCHQSFMQLISFSDWYTNNHILNSVFMKYAAMLFGNSELALRLPNLVLLLVYMLFAYLLFRKSHPIVALVTFLLLSSNRLLMDLFGLARGYGLSCGFMLMSLYFFLAYLRESKKSNLALFHFAALLAALSNFTLLIFYAALLLVYNLHCILKARFILKQRFEVFKVNKAHILPLGLVGAVLYEPVRRVITYSKLNFGGKNGFFEDTVGSLITNTFHYSNFSSPVEAGFMSLFAFIVLSALFLILRNCMRGNSSFFDRYQNWIVCNLLLVVISIIIIAQHHILGNDYPVARFSIFLFPLFILHFGFFIDYLMSFRYRKAIAIGISGLAATSIISFVNTSDLYSSAEWGYDKHTKDMILALDAHQESNLNLDRQINLACNWLFEPTINFYRVTKGYDWLAPVRKEDAYGKEDFYFIKKQEVAMLGEVKYKIIKDYPDQKTFLIKLIQQPE